MKRLILGIIFLFLMAGCSNETYKKAMDQGKLALASKEYDTAEASFDLALEEKKNDKEAKILQEQTTKMIRAIKEKSSGNIEQAIDLFQEVEKEKDGSTTLQNQAKEQKALLTEHKELKSQYIDQLEKAEKLKTDKKYDEAKVIVNKIINDTGQNQQFIMENQRAEELNKQIDGILTQQAEVKKKEEELKIEKKKEDDIGKLEGSWMSQDSTDRPVGLEIEFNSGKTGGEFMEHNIFGKGTTIGDFRILSMDKGIISVELAFLVGERKQKVDLKLEENTLTVHHEFMGGTESVELVRSE
ncbi:tetratricopeptide repeat protein [Bacillus wiedmannii]|uniref:tetratricopeptide repeat protein n=1 Tax=Bacillus wiedmannii TaxID=1890302 RepID=UPI003D9976E1